LIGVSAIALWVTAKAAFVRHDPHSALFFFTVAVLVVGVRTSRPSVTAPVVTLFASGLVLTTLGAGSSVAGELDPGSSVRSFLTQVTYAALPGRREAATREAKEHLRATYALPDPVLARLSQGTVHVDPHETTLAWAFDLEWKPVPVFQRYLAYTARSDRGNARALESMETAPDRILRQEVLGLDGRNDLWDSPRYMLELVCRYRQTVAMPPWQVLERTSSRHCGPMRFGPEITFRAGETTSVPRASARELVVVWLELEESFADRLQTFLFKPSEPITVVAGVSEFRVATPEVAGPLLVRIPDDVGWSAQFGGGVSYDALRINQDGKATFAIVPLT
jgi:hypothetical protein